MQNFKSIFYEDYSDTLQTCEVYFNWFYLKIFPCVSLKWSKSIIIVTFAKNDHIPFLKVRKINIFFFSASLLINKF